MFPHTVNAVKCDVPCCNNDADGTVSMPEDEGFTCLSFCNRCVEGIERHAIFHYIRCRIEGCSHKLAEMLAAQQPPSVQSDTTFFAGHCNGSQFEGSPVIGDHYKSIAQDAGVNIQGAIYQSGLARFPGDPEAWVRSRQVNKDRVEARGWGCEGDFTVKPREREAPARIPLAEDIVQEKLGDMIAEAGDAREINLEAAREQIIKTHGPQPVESV